jgi:hypothetical protein
MADLSAPAGFKDGDSFVYDGELASLPAWADKGWATYANGPALAVPKGDPEKGPYATDVARIGDTVLTNKKQDRFAVVPAQVVGDQPGDPDNPATADKPLPAKPVGTEAASLEDLDKTGVLPFDQMNKEQQSQMIARGTAPPEAMKEAGLGPSGLAGGSYPSPAPEPEPAPTPSRRSRSHSEE